MDSLPITADHKRAQQNFFAEKTWDYHFRELPFVFEEKRLKKMIDKYQEHNAKNIKNWNEEKNSEWTCRFFTAAKLLLSATLHINTANIIEDKNLLITSPYLRYYTLLSLFRIVCYTLPELKWEKGKVIRLSHDHSAKHTLDYLEKFDEQIAKNVKALLKELKNRRELTTYHASFFKTDAAENARFVSIFSLLAEIAQFNSEIFETMLNEDETAREADFAVIDNYLEKITFLQSENHLGSSDYELPSIVAKSPKPRSLMSTLKTGYIDSQLNWWAKQDDFNEHSAEHFFGDRRIIFDLP